MRFSKTFIELFVGETELFFSGAFLVTFGTVLAMSFSMNEFFGTTIYLSRIFLMIFLSMMVAGVSIQISSVKRLTDGYVGYVFSSAAAIANSLSLILEAIEMTLYGTSWFEIEFLKNNQANNTFLSLIGFVIFLFSVAVTIFSILDLISVSGEAN